MDRSRWSRPADLHRTESCGAHPSASYALLYTWRVVTLYQGLGWIPLQQIAWDWPLHTPDGWVTSDDFSRAEATTLISDLSWLPFGPFIHWEAMTLTLIKRDLTSHVGWYDHRRPRRRGYIKR